MDIKIITPEQFDLSLEQARRQYTIDSFRDPSNRLPDLTKICEPGTEVFYMQSHGDDKVHDDDSNKCWCYPTMELILDEDGSIFRVFVIHYMEQ